MSSRRLPWALATLLAAGLFVGCSETTLPVTGVYHPTLIEVSPDNFLSGVPCGSSAGALRRYVATVYDVEYEADGQALAPDDDDGGADGGAGGDTGAAPETRQCPVDALPGPAANPGFALPSSNPVDCAKPVAFARVVDGHRYRARIEGYDRTDIEPLASGTSLMVAKDTGERVGPTWVWTCGDHCPARARSYVSSHIEDCVLASEAGTVPSGPASVEVALTLGNGDGAPTCGAGAGQVDHFEVTLADTTWSAACGESVTLSDVPAPGALALPVLAFERKNPEPRWGTLCSASPVTGLSVKAGCPALSEQGAFDIEPTAALATLSTDCDALSTLPGALRLDLIDAQGETIGQPRFVDPRSCGAPVRFTGVTSGLARVRATLLAAGNELGHAVCTASVVPTQSVSATCSAEP